MTDPAGQRDPSNPMPGIGAITGLAFVVVLVPAIVVAVILNAFGAPLGVSCMLGLLMAFVGMAFYPRVLRKLGWLPTVSR
jgi:membrane protein YdbS with pleckstrin-like domain